MNRHPLPLCFVPCESSKSSAKNAKISFYSTWTKSQRRKPLGLYLLHLQWIPLRKTINKMHLNCIHKPEKDDCLGNRLFQLRSDIQLKPSGIVLRTVKAANIICLWWNIAEYLAIYIR